MQDVLDLVIIGGGINGAGIARDAAGRGLSVLLCEQDDLAQHTSSASTKLIHGGLRYLEYYEFSLVRKALQEREVLLRAAPHIIWPLRFVMPHDQHLRPAWLIRAGLFLYDHLARRELLQGSTAVQLAKHPAGQPLHSRFQKGFIYSDGWVQDARLVVLNAMDAARRGAEILTRTRCVSASRADGVWEVALQSLDGQVRQVKARALVNAAGPWVGQVLKSAIGVQAERSVRLVKGSHIVVPKLFDHDHAYIFQNPDKRIIFAIPYETNFTLIGTTDVEYKGDAAKVAIDQDEIAYLCEMAGRYFKQQITPAEVVWHYSGVRPLLDDESASAASVTRDYSLELDADKGEPPLLSVFGGKITTFRKLAEEAVDRLQPLLNSTAQSWTANAVLPGGDLPAGGIAAYTKQLQAVCPSLPASLLARYARTYGSCSMLILSDILQGGAMAEEVLPGVYAAELRYLFQQEWARTAEDILWRRSKLGLHLPADAQPRLDAWLRQHQDDLLNL